MKSISAILKRLETLEKNNQGEKVLMNFNEVQKYLGFSKAHLYRLCYLNNIPCHNPTGRTLFFFKHELDEWIESKKAFRKHGTERGGQMSDAKGRKGSKTVFSNSNNQSVRKNKHGFEKNCG